MLAPRCQIKDRAGGQLRRFSDCLLALIVTAIAGCNGDAPPSIPAPYAYPTTPPTCSAIPPPADPHLKTEDGIEMWIRTPANYRADFAHPLLVVFAAAGMTPRQSERFTGYTPVATAAGFVVAYVRHVRPSLATMRKLSRVPATVSSRYCVDATQIFLAGHSDGGTAATAIAVMPDTAGIIAGLAPSAAGFNGKDLAGFHCAPARPVIVWHGARDRLFPGWGREAAAWWARCNQCKLTPVPHAGGCVRYTSCVAPVMYCEGADGHTAWPELASRTTLDFFKASAVK